MLEDLRKKSKKIVLTVILNKTKIMSSSQHDIITDNTIIDKVDHYVYLGHKIRVGKENQTTEIMRRIRLAWMAFGKLLHLK